MSKPITGVFVDGEVIIEDQPNAMELYDKSRFGALVKNRIDLGVLEACYLLESEKIIITNRKNKPFTVESFIKSAKKYEPNFLVKYQVFKDMRKRGYIVKTALKFGADFRVYDRGVKPGEDHARWILYPVHESSVLTWHEFSAKNRVAHSTRKRLLLGVVDDEGDVSYWEARWLRP